MMLELVLSLSSGLVSGLGVWFWAQNHSHDDLVPRTEMRLLRAMMEAQHAAILRELSQLQELISRYSRR